MNLARQEILQRIRKGLGAVSSNRAEHYEEIERRYTQSGGAGLRVQAGSV